MERAVLVIMQAGGNQVRCSVNKWKFSDKMMGEQFITFNITSETPIPFAVGDYCVFRGETFTLNYTPSVKQSAKSKERQDAFTYENVKFESFREELTRCQMLDIVGTSDLYDTTMGTNYTGSSDFNLFCGEVTVNGRTSTAVCTLAVKMQVNLDRMYGVNTWRIYVDTTTAVDGVLVTHTDDKMLSFNGDSVAKALEDVHNEFDLDYYVKGRVIRIGYIQNNITSDDDSDAYSFGFGRGYPVFGDDGKGLFEIKMQSESNQLLVTRLRALGSTKNLPYRYYNKKYGGQGSALTQTLFPTNLQLPDTFLPEGNPSSPAQDTKWRNNYTRRNAPETADLRYVKGDTNDAYIDKGDDATACAEGVREACARWDGSDSNLQEIYPTIEGIVYRELRGALVPDQDGNTGQGAFPNYGADERVDGLLAIGYKQGNTMVDDANVGTGILPEDGTTDPRTYRTSIINPQSLRFPAAFSYNEETGEYRGGALSLFSVDGVAPGSYFMSPTNMDMVVYSFSLAGQPLVSAKIGYILTVVAQSISTGESTVIATYRSELKTKNPPSTGETALPALPDVGENPQQVSSLDITNEMGTCNVRVLFTPILKDVSSPFEGVDISFSLQYRVGKPTSATIEYTPEYVWCLYSDRGSMADTFHVFIKDMGFEIEAAPGETPVMSMKTGMCVGRDFEIGNNIQKAEYNGKKGYMLTLNRAKDTGLNIYYPSSQYQISSGDQFVLLGISMPDAYIKAAEIRLLRAATDYLAENSVTKSSYQVSLDEIFLQRNYDNMVAAGTPEKSIYWRLYAGMKFTFDGIPEEYGDALPECNITIDSVTISVGESLVPKVEIRLNDDVQQGTLQKITSAIDKIYNGSIFASPSVAGAGGGLSENRAKNLFLSKTTDDTARGNMTFEQNVVVGGSVSAGGEISSPSDLSIGGNASISGNMVVVGDESVSGNHEVDGDAHIIGDIMTGGDIKSDNYNGAGSFATTGWKIDQYGNADLESARIRSFLEVVELLINRLQAQEGDTLFTDNDQIIDVELEQGGTYKLTLKEKWDGYYTAQQEGNIVKGIINTLAAKDAGVSDESDNDPEDQGSDDGGNKYYTSWMRVVATQNTAGSGLDRNEIRVVLYGDEDTPAQKNFAPCNLMTIARWGCVLNPNEAGISEGEKQSRIRRQQMFLISTSDGRITKLSHVNTPILRETNYGTTLGTLPEFIRDWSIASRLIDGRDYLYAQGVVVGDFIKVDIQGDPIVQYVDCGEWVTGQTYFVNEHNDETLQWETHDVWHNGVKWRCEQHQPVTSGGVSTYYEPKWGSQYWAFLEGDNQFSMDFTSSRGARFREGNVSTTITPTLYWGNEDITNQIAASNWYWTRTSDVTNGERDAADAVWNSNHTGIKNLSLTNNDMPTWWSIDNRIKFTCHVTISDSNTLSFGI